MSFDIIEVRYDLAADNDRFAARMRERLNKDGVYLVNLMASPGAGKTSVLCRVLDARADRFSMGVMEADMAADVDARTVEARGAAVVQLRTGTSCHMDAKMTLRGLDAFPKPLPDLIFLENVGNLVCPAEFDVGADLKLMILSVPEGDDKPLKYPLMFENSDVFLINKMDTIDYFDFNFDVACANILKRNPKAKIFPISAKTGEGLAEVAQWIEEEFRSIIDNA